MPTIGSTAALKIDGTQEALNAVGSRSIVHGVKAASEVPDQPIGPQTLRGAENRAFNAQKLAPNDNCWLGMESGLYKRRFLFWTWWVDKCILVVRFPSGLILHGETKSLRFPKRAVDEALRTGQTVGQVLQKWGLVQDHQDPHRDLAGKSRRKFICEGLIPLFKEAQSNGEHP